MSDTKILYKAESYNIIGACMKVHRGLQAGFLEAVYEEALSQELNEEKIPFKRQVKVPVYYGKKKLNKYYKADFICYDKIILEIKAVNAMPRAFYKQLNNYLKATHHQLGLLINFGKASLEYKRIINTR